MTLVTACLFLFISPRPAEASILSFLGNLLKADEGEEISAPDNYEKENLLEAVLNSDPISAKGETDLTIINQNTLVSNSGPMGTTADIEEIIPKKDQISIYVVRKGDSLSKIADMFGVSANTLLWANDMSRGDALKEGQKLIILPITGVRYTVKKSDNIKSIAKKFNGNAFEIINFNDLPSNGEISVGQIIVIPNGEYVQATPIIQAKKSSNYIPVSSGYYLRPADGRRSQGLHGNNAIDIASSCNVPVIAAAEGDVIISRIGGWNSGYGSYVVLSHPNGTQTLYAHLENVDVIAGWHVAKGQTIGSIGHTGLTIPAGTRGCHLHFEVRGAKNPF